MFCGRLAADSVSPLFVIVQLIFGQLSYLWRLCLTPADWQLANPRRPLLPEDAP